MTKEPAGNFTFTISAFRMTRGGGFKLVLEISESEASKALALAMYPEAAYSADVFLLK